MNPFTNLLGGIVTKIGHLDSTSINPEFSQFIQSKRTFSKMFTVKELLDTLEERDAFWETNTDVLEQVVGRVNVLYGGCDELLQTIITYKKLSYETPPCCLICKVPITNNLPRIECLSLINRPNPTAPNVPPEDDDWHEVFLYLSVNLSKDWRRLGTSLRISQGTLDGIDYTRDTLENQILLMLEAWRKEQGDSATKELLVTKLRSRVLKRKDLAEGIEQQKYKDY